MTTFIEMWHPALPGTPHVLVPEQAVDLYAAKGWLVVDGTTPAPEPIYLTPGVGDLRYLKTGDPSDPASSGGMALRAAFVASSLPSYAAPRARRFDPARSVYNAKATNTRRARAKLGAAQAGTALCRVLCAGDSLTAGDGASPGTTDYPTWLRQALTTAGYPTGELVYLFNNLGGDPRWALGGAWDAASISIPFIASHGAGNTATFTSDTAGTVLDILTFGLSAAFTYSIDGGATVAVTGLSGASAAQLITITGLGNTTHTVTITSVAGDTYLIAAGIRPANSVQVMNSGIAGAKASDLIAAGDFSWAGSLATTTATVPDVVLLELGVNETLQGVAPATFEANLTTMVQTYQAAGADVLLAASHTPDPSGNPGGYGSIPTANFQAIVAAIYDVADARDVPLLDLTDRFGDYSTLNAIGLAANSVHLDAAGYAAKAQAWRDALGW